jgi:PhnB protein
MKQLNAYLYFNGNCREAMEFYRECLGGDLKIMAVGESPMAAQMPSDMKDKVMHAVLKSDGMVIMASDTMGAVESVRGNMVALCINGNEKKEIESLLSKLAKNNGFTSQYRAYFRQACVL